MSEFKSYMELCEEMSVLSALRQQNEELKKEIRDFRHDNRRWIDEVERATLENRQLKGRLAMAGLLHPNFDAQQLMKENQELKAQNDYYEKTVINCRKLLGAPDELTLEEHAKKIYDNGARIRKALELDQECSIDDIIYAIEKLGESNNSLLRHNAINQDRLKVHGQSLLYLTQKNEELVEELKKNKTSEHTYISTPSFMRSAREALELPENATIEKILDRCRENVGVIKRLEDLADQRRTEYAVLKEGWQARADMYKEMADDYHQENYNIRKAAELHCEADPDVVVAKIKELYENTKELNEWKDALGRYIFKEDELE